jgi:hypothetical protein
LFPAIFADSGKWLRQNGPRFHRKGAGEITSQVCEKGGGTKGAGLWSRVFCAIAQKGQHLRKQAAGDVDQSR